MLICLKSLKNSQLIPRGGYLRK
uniref:Uncharacterized protein n=1 Tax=Arundo donax TaxID=35708 RepID=A0A0A9BA12_ARUDO